MDNIFGDQSGFTDGETGEVQTGSELALSSPPYPTEGEGVMNFYFPVEIVVAGSLAPQEREIIQAQIYQDLHDAIINRLA